jgi:hypothetical protein
MALTLEKPAISCRYHQQHGDFRTLFFYSMTQRLLIPYTDIGYVLERFLYFMRYSICSNIYLATPKPAVNFDESVTELHYAMKN